MKERVYICARVLFVLSIKCLVFGNLVIYLDLVHVYVRFSMYLLNIINLK